MQPEISVIIPVYNAAGFLPRCLDSILQQELQDIEIICINDGSTDASEQVISEYAGRDDRIKLISQPNKGAAAARNAGIKTAKGKYIAFIDADDFFSPGLFKLFTEKNAQNDVDIFMFNGTITDHNQQTKQYFYSNAIFKPEVSENDAVDYSHFANFFYGNQSICNKIYRTDFLRENNILLNEGTIFEDTLFYFVTVINAKKIKFTYTPYYNYIFNGQSVTNTIGANAFGLFEIFDAMENEAKKQGLWEFFRYALFQLEYEKFIETLSKTEEKIRPELFERAKNYLKERITELDPNIYARLVNINYCGALLNYTFDQFADTLLLSRSEFKFSQKRSEKPLFSIIVPVYNTRRFLPLCFKSLINQTCTDFEIICVNDGSPDDSQALLEEYAAKDARITVIKQKNKGLGGARNTGIRAAKGDYLLFVDSDDWLSLSALEKIKATVEKTPADIGLFGFYEFIDQTMQLHTADHLKLFEGKDCCACAEIADKMYISQCVWNKFYKREFFIDNNLFFAENVYFEDLTVHTKAMVKAASIAFCRHDLYYYRIRGNSIMQSEYSHKKIDDLIYAFSSTIRWLKREKLFADYRAPLAAFANVCLQMHLRKAGNTYGKILHERIVGTPELRELLGIAKY